MHKLIASLLVLVTLLSGLVMPAFAQGEDNSTPTPETGLIYGFRAEVLFPVVVRFFVGINASLDQITQANLTISQDGALLVNLSLDPTLYTSEDSTPSAAELVYDWDLSSGPVPRPFAPLDYRWEIKTADGETSVAESSVIFLDRTQLPWQTVGRPPLVVHFANSDIAAETIWEEAMAAYGLFNHNTERTILFEAVVYDPTTDYCEERTIPGSDEVELFIVSREDEHQYDCSREAFARLYDEAGILFLERESFGYTEMQDFLITTIVRAAYRDLWGEAQVPDWFEVGLALMHRLSGRASALEVVRTAARTQTAYDLNDLATELPGDANYPDRALWEAQSYTLVMYLADHFGAQAPFTLAREVVQQNGDFDAALATLNDGAPFDLWSDWNRWIFTSAAEKALNWTPYQDTTPTPTATATATPITPSPTPLPTHTSTYTTTPTIVGDLPNPVVITTYTSTPRRTPTNTALPPGSLPTAAPPASKTTDSGDDNEPLVQVGLVAAALVAGVLIGVGFLISRRRR